MMRNLMSTALALATATLLVACGGGGSDDGKPAAAADPFEVPASAGQSNAGWVSYLVGLPDQPAENREPVSIDGFAPPTSDTDEPIPVGG